MDKEKTNTEKFTRRGVLRLFGAAGLGLAAANTDFFNARAQEKKPLQSKQSGANLQGAGFYRFKVGDLECVAVSDGSIFLPPAEFFSAPKAEVEQILRENFLPTERLTLHINTLIVKSNGKTILMDTGGGKNLGPTAGFLPANLEKAGIKPAEITDVVFSHAHFDHIGGTIAGKNKNFFPNAKFHISQKEWDEAIKKSDYFGGKKIDETMKKVIFDAIDEDLAPLKNRISFFSSDTEIAPGIVAMPAYGHTPGHAVYQVKSGAESLLFVGDLIHHAAVQLARPEITMFGDSYPSEAAAVRQKILKRIAAEKQSMMGAHLPFPGVGHIRARAEKGAAYEWFPIEWQW